MSWEKNISHSSCIYVGIKSLFECIAESILVRPWYARNHCTYSFFVQYTVVQIQVSSYVEPETCKC